jgi:putative transcriptional regulator, crp/fnr family
MGNELDTLYQAFGILRQLKAEEQAALASAVRRWELKPRQYIMQAGDICQYYTFVVKGCLKMYHIDGQGKEHGLLFAVEQEWIADLGSAHHRIPSSCFIEAIEPTTILQIAIPNLWQLWNRYHIFDRYFRVITEDAYAMLQRRLILSYSANGRERYVAFIQDFPHLVSRLPALQIASFLGITPEFLSKVKRELLRYRSPRGKL